MKHLFFIFLLVGCSALVSAQMPKGKNFKITLHVDSVLSAEEQWVYMHYYEANEFIADSAKLSKGSHSVVLYGAVDQEKRVTILFARKGPLQFCLLVNPEDNIEAYLDENDGDTKVDKEVKGSPSTNELFQSNQLSRAIYVDIRNLEGKLMFPDLTEAETKLIGQKVDSLKRELLNNDLEMARSSNSPIAALGVLFRLKSNIEKAVYDSLLSSVIGRFPNHTNVKRLKGEIIDYPPMSKDGERLSDRIECITQGRLTLFSASPKNKQKVVSMGINDLSLLSVDNKQVAVSQLEGEYIFVDFWATWCIPCINELPIVLHAKEIYGDRLTVCAVSLDKNRTLWKKGLEKYKMQHFINLTVLDKDGKADEQIEQLGITAIPTNFLLDKNHQVVGTNLHGKELINTLDRLLKNR